LIQSSSAFDIQKISSYFVFFSNFSPSNYTIDDFELSSLSVIIDAYLILLAPVPEIFDRMVILPSLSSLFLIEIKSKEIVKRVV